MKAFAAGLQSSASPSSDSPIHVDIVSNEVTLRISEEMSAFGIRGDGIVVKMPLKECFYGIDSAWITDRKSRASFADTAKELRLIADQIDEVLAGKRQSIVP